MPFFILANPRSGSSMFRLMLNSHSNITVPPESGFALWYAEKYANKKVFTPELYEEFINDLLCAKKFETWQLSKEKLNTTIGSAQPNSYIELVNSVYKTYAETKRKTATKYGDKNNYYVDHIDSLIRYFPDEKLVFLVRDGRDIAASYKKIDPEKIDSVYTPKLSKNIEVIAREWTKNIDNFLRISSKNVNTILVKYEDLLNNPVNELKRVFEFLGEQFEEQVLNFNEYNDEPEEFLQWKSKTLEKVDKGNMNKYKNELLKEEIETFNSVAKHQLLSLGYDVN